MTKNTPNCNTGLLINSEYDFLLLNIKYQGRILYDIVLRTICLSMNQQKQEWYNRRTIFKGIRKLVRTKDIHHKEYQIYHFSLFRNACK